MGKSLDRAQVSLTDEGTGDLALFDDGTYKEVITTQG